VHAIVRELGVCNASPPCHFMCMSSSQRDRTGLLTRNSHQVHVELRRNLYNFLPQRCHWRWCRQVLRPKLHAHPGLGGTADHLVALRADDLQSRRLICIVTICMFRGLFVQLIPQTAASIIWLFAIKTSDD
jgi:hypothetical protein